MNNSFQLLINGHKLLFRLTKVYLYFNIKFLRPKAQRMTFFVNMEVAVLWDSTGGFVRRLSAKPNKIN
jgi:hypothetical protein